MKKNRIDFSSVIIRKVRDRAAYICSKPDCRVSTIAPSKENPSGIIYIGKVAHIYSASPNGPRTSIRMDSSQISSIENAIFLCSNCAVEIDNGNGKDYPAEMLLSWKTIHEDWICSTLNKPTKNDMGIFNQSNINQQGGIAAGNINIGKLVVSNVNDRIRHDKNIFIESSKLLDEKLLLRNLRLLKGMTTVPINLIYPFSYYYDFFGLVSNNYLDPKIEASNRELIQSIHKFGKHIGISYIRDLSTESHRPVKGGPLHYNLFMRTELSENPQKELQTKQYLIELGESVKISYVRYRSDIKQILCI